MRIIGISGLWCGSSAGRPIAIWYPLREAFKQRMPSVRFSVEQRYFLHPWNILGIRRFISEILDKRDIEEEVLLVGHSLGGIIACAIAHKMMRAKVIGVVTVFTPHRFPFTLFPWLYGTMRRLSVPIISFHGRRDTLVRWGTRHPHAIEHNVLDCDHHDDFQLEHAHEVASVAIRHMLPVRNS